MTDSSNNNRPERLRSTPEDIRSQTLPAAFHQTIRQVEQELRGKETTREAVLGLCRNIRRASTGLISAIHHRSVIASEFDGLENMVNDLHEIVKDHFDLFHKGFTDNALQEYCEVRILHALITGNQAPDPHMLRVSNEAYILGLGDVIGELRRLVLDALMNMDTSQAQQYFGMMQEIYELLQMFDFPDALVGIRRKRDAGRGIIERTRADLTVALRSIGLEQALQKNQMGQRELSTEQPEHIEEK